MGPELDHDYNGDYSGRFEDDFDPEAFDGGLDAQAKREENYEERFTAAGKAIKKKRRFIQESDVSEFFSEYGDIAGMSSTKDSGNLLHALVDAVKHIEDMESEDVELLVRRLVDVYPDLLKYPNKDGHNPVYMAIRASNHQLVDYIISTCVENQDRATGPDHMECLDDALRMKVHEGRASLHVALKEGFDAETTKMLIATASDETLATQDDHGRTAMHYAVAFGQCTDVRAQLIDLFIERDLSAVQSKPRPERTFLDLADDSGCSVYQEHQNTRAVVTKRYNDWAAKRARAPDKPASEHLGGASRMEKPAPRDPKESVARSQTNTRDVRYPNPLRPGRDDVDGELDDREKLRQRRKEEEAARRKEADVTRRDGRGDGRGDRFKEREVVTGGRDGSQGPRNRADEMNDNTVELVVRTNRLVEPSPNSGIKRTNTGTVETKPAQDKPAPRPPILTKKSTTADKGNMTVWNKNSDDMLMKLKLHYMRTRNTEMAIFFIYGTNMDDVQISFDYDRLPRKMLWNEFVKRFGPDSKSGLKFDKVLQYVTFPQVEVRLKGRLADAERDAELQSGVRQIGALGRKDMKYFFEWLHKKGVRHIIRVCVQDSGDSGEKVHSDEAIQQSLQHFVIEHLDWQKTDLDPETILQVSSKAVKESTAADTEDYRPVDELPDRQLKELCLRWSGNNAVLRAWSEPEGLPALPELKTVYLFKPPPDKTLDNLPWINKKIKDFQQRLNRSREGLRFKARVVKTPDTEKAAASFGNIQVIARDAGTDEERKVTSRDTPQFTTSAPMKGVNSHRWLDATTRFAAEMEPFWKNTLKEFMEARKNQGTPERVEDDVVVALIDDGVDMFDSALSNRLLEGKSFDFHDGKLRPPFSSARGHGTVMASMILRVCPMAKIYPIRLRTWETHDGKSQIDRKYAAQALQAALDKKVTIISMSWTLPMPKGKSEDKDSLHSVLQKAVDSKVLMFCSSPDGGKFTDLDYPSGPWRERFFRIGAARADGSVFEWTPDDGITFVLPGVDVVKDQVGSSAFEAPSPGAGGVTNRIVDFKYETGSSVATALAAGLAAMVIYCVKASILSLKTANQNKGPIVGIPIPDNGATMIAERDAMWQAFRSLGRTTTNSFIQVWEELDKVSEMLENGRARSLSPQAKLENTERFVKFGLKLAKRDLLA